MEKNKQKKRNIIIVWLRNDLRLLDNEALFQATKDAAQIIPIYCFDPRHFGQTKFDLAKTGAFRAQFLLESVQDLRYQLQDLNANLIVRTGKPEEVVFALAKYYEVKAVYCHQEATDEEIKVEEKLESHLATMDVPLEYFWGSTLYHFDDLPMDVEDLPDIFTQFRKKIEKQTTIRPSFPIPEKIQLPETLDEGKIPSLQQLGITHQAISGKSVLPFKGGATQAMLRLKDYFWTGDHLRNYKETRNGLLGADYSSKFSPWLANGTISPRIIYEAVQDYESKRVKNQSTYWLIFELIWRDYFRFVAMKFGNDLFKSHGLKRVPNFAKKDAEKFTRWCNGETGVPFIDANMRELNATGFMSNRGRQNVASFLVKDLKVSWLLGATYFETHLLDYDPCSNYGNWNYVAGIGNDPRENRYFNVLTQAKRYDPDGTYVKHWCPELKRLPSKMVQEPYLLTEAEQRYIGVKIGKNYPNPCFDLRTWKAKQKAKTR